jgi:molybdopterin/thiamine biosynthesis adenylyltransferase
VIPSTISIVFPEAVFNTVKIHLFKDCPKEQIAFLLCGYHHTDNHLRLLVQEAILPTQDDLAYQYRGGVCPTKAFQVRVYERCYQEGFSLIDVHSHPFAQGNVAFSGIDDASEIGSPRREGTFPYVARKIPNIYHASMVLGTESLDARLYDPERHHTVAVSEVRVLGERIRIMAPTSTARSLKNSEDFSSYSRQILAFGKAGQELLKQITVGVVGVGGIGSIVVEGLARLGVGALLLVDEDVVSTSNLSRLIGSYPGDAENGRPKVEILVQHVQRITPTVQVTAIHDSVLNPLVLHKILKADVLITATDTQASRMVVNTVAMQYLIPYLDLGTQILVDEKHTTIMQAGGRVRVVRPGRRCLRCYPGELDDRAIRAELRSTFDRNRDLELGYITGVVISDPSVIFLNMTIASLGLTELFNLIVGFKPPTSYVAYHLLHTSVKPVKVGDPNPDCVVCGKDGVMALGDIEPLQDVREHDPLSEVPDLASHSQH